MSESSENQPEETNKSSESETTEKPVLVVDEVLVSSEKMAVEYVPVTEVSTPQDSAVDKTDGVVSIVTTESSVTVVETVKLHFSYFGKSRDSSISG